MADPTQILQVVMNLGTNAYQAMADRGGVLTIGLSTFHSSEPVVGENVSAAAGDYIRLQVRSSSLSSPRSL